MQTVNHGYGGDRRLDRAHALEERVLGLVRADDGPRGTVVDHLFVVLLGTWRRLSRENSVVSEVKHNL